jgi:hypothetical protein
MPPTSPAAAVATPVTTATFEPLPLPFERELELPAPLPDDRACELRLPDPELRLRDDAADERRLDALALLGLLREPEEDLLLEDPLLLLRFEVPLRLLLLEALWLFGLDPFELREFVCFLFEERVLPWAMAPP